MMPPVVGKRKVVDETNYRIGWALEEKRYSQIRRALPLRSESEFLLTN